MSDPRDEFIAQVAKGRTFVEVGGLWGTVSEKVSVAHRAGAASVAMFDVTPEGEELWTRFHARLKELGVPPCECYVGDIASYKGRRYQVSHCAGVLYHHPNPMEILTGLRRMTSEYLVFTSAVSQTRIETSAGTLEIPECAVLFTPALPERERLILAEYWSRFGVRAGGINLACHYHLDELNASDLGPWWFLPTVPALKAMTRVCGFEVIGEQSWWNGNAHTLLCRAVPDGLKVSV